MRGGVRRTYESSFRLKKYKIAEAKLRVYQHKFNQIKLIDDEGQAADSSSKVDQLAALNALVKSGASIIQEYQKFRVAVQTDPMKIEEARMGLSHGMQFANSLALNQARLENLSMQYRQNALLRVYQLVLTLSTISSLYCDRTLAENRKMQLSILESCENTLRLVAKGEFDQALGGSPEVGLVPQL